MGSLGFSALSFIGIFCSSLLWVLWDSLGFFGCLFEKLMDEKCLSMHFSTIFIKSFFFIPVIYSVTSDSGPSQISVVLDTTATEAVTREWSMKIYQYECSSPNLAPSGCLQYFTAASGQFQSFNYRPNIRETQGDGPSHLANLNYAVCFRIENGFCGIKYGQVTSDTFSFTISGDSRSVHLNCLNRVCGIFPLENMSEGQSVPEIRI